MGRVKSWTDVQDRAIYAVAMAGAGPMGQAQERRVRAPPHPLYGSRAGTPDTCRAQPDQIYRDRNSLPAERRQTSSAGKPPLPSQPTGTRQKFCDRGRLPWRNPASPVTIIEISNGREGDVVDAVVDAAGGVGHSKSRSIRAAAA